MLGKCLLAMLRVNPKGLSLVPCVQDIPQLRRKRGSEVVSALGIETVGQLAGIPCHTLIAR